MKKLVSIIVLFALIASFAACSKGKTADKDSLPKRAYDEEVLKKWDEYEMLSGVPRYKREGITNGFSEGEDGMVVVSFLGVMPDDFEAYCAELTEAGFRLAEGSSIWMTEGLNGFPQFEKGNKRLTVVWSINGSLDIGAEIKPAD